MNALAANDFEAADLLALARPGDGAPGRWSRCSAMPSCRACWDYHGGKVKTAESLGVSRATIYRKIHQYGIITPAS